MSESKFDQNFQSMRSFFHFLVLWSFAVAQPLYAKVAENLPFLLAHRIDGFEVVVYALTLLLPIPLILGLLVWCFFAISTVAGRIIQALLLVVLGFFIGFPILSNTLGADQLVAVALASGLALFLVFAYDTKFWKGLLDILTPAPLLFVLFFLLFSPVRLLLFDDEVQGGGDGRDRLDVPVVLIMLDEFPTYTMLTRNGELDHDRLPGFSRLAELGTWYPRATTVAEATIMAVPAALSGILPAGDRKQPPVYQFFPENLFDQVSSQRRIWSIENGTRLCRPGRCESLDASLEADEQHGQLLKGLGFRTLLLDSVVIWGHMSLPERARLAWLPELGAQWQGFVDSPVEEIADESDDHEPHAIRWNQRMLEIEGFINALEWAGRGSFHYLHTLMPHAPWIHLPDGRVYDLTRAESIFGMVPEHTNNTGIKHLWHDDDWPTIIAEQRYLLQLQFVDHLIGRVLDRLQDSQSFDDVMLIVTADHGSAFTSGTSRRALTEDNLAEVLSVPLFIKYPGQREGRIDQKPAELLDVAPTIRDVLGLGTEGLDGRSLLTDASAEFWPRLVDDRGEYQDFDRARFESHFDAVTERLHRRFVLDEEDQFPVIAAFAEWHGLAVSELGATRQGLEQSLHLTGGGQWQQINPDSRFLPARIIGQLQQDEEEDRVFVAAVNDRISGFGRVYSYPGSNRTLEIMIQPTAFIPGRNLVEVFRMIREGEDHALERVFSNADTVRLVSGKESPLALQVGEVSVDVSSGPPYGNVRLVHDPDQDLFILQGWSLDPISGRIADIVYAFVNEELIGSTIPSERRPGLVDRFGSDDFLHAGFRLPLPMRVDWGENYGVLRVIASDEQGNTAQLPISGIIDGGFPFDRDMEFRPVRIPEVESTPRSSEIYVLNTWIEPASEDFDDTPGVWVKGDLTGSNDRVRWAGSELQICFKVADSSGDFKLEFEGVPFIHQPEAKEQNLFVSVNQEVFGHWLLDERRMRNFDATFTHGADLDDEGICIQFSMPDAVVPSELGISQDRRELALAFRRLRLVRID